MFVIFLVFSVVHCTYSSTYILHCRHNICAN